MASLLAANPVVISKGSVQVLNEFIILFNLVWLGFCLCCQINFPLSLFAGEDVRVGSQEDRHLSLNWKQKGKEGKLGF